MRHLQPLGDGEWVMPQRHLTGPQYEPLAAQFYPTKFAAARWATLAQQAGMRSIVVTSRHHDGFSIFATTQNKYNIVDSTPTAKTSSVSLPKSVIARVSSSSSTTRDWTGIIPITICWAAPGMGREDRLTASGPAVSIS